MGLKCSVLGHAYGETTVERDREERGSEVVITIRELETCDRCGDTRIVTENKEVTTIETPDDSPDVTAADAMEAMGEDASVTEPGAGGDSAPSVADTGDDAATDDGAIVEDAEGGAAVTDESVGSPSPDAVEDQGAEILDDDGEADDDAVDDELADPTIENDAEVPGESTEDEDAVILDDGPASTGDDGAGDAVEADASEEGDHTIDADESSPFAAPADEESGDDPLGEWPEETLRDTDDDWTPSEELSGTVGDVDPDANVDRELTTNSAVTVPEGEFHCEGCGYTTPVEASSLRAGDYCPECHSETLVHRAEE